MDDHTLILKTGKGVLLLLCQFVILLKKDKERIVLDSSPSLIYTEIQRSYKTKYHMKNRLISITIIGIGLSYLFKLLTAISNVTLIQGIGLPIARHSKIAGFLYVFISIMIYGFIYSLMHKEWEYNFKYDLFRSVLMATLTIGASYIARVKSTDTYSSSSMKYLLQGFVVIVTYDLITGVVMPCISGYSIHQLLFPQIEWTLTRSVFSLVPIGILSYAIDRFIKGDFSKLPIFNLILNIKG